MYYIKWYELEQPVWVPRQKVMRILNKIKQFNKQKLREKNKKIKKTKKNKTYEVSDACSHV